MSNGNRLKSGAFEAEIRRLSGANRAAFWVWLRRWSGKKPARVWWVFDCDTLRWRME